MNVESTAKIFLAEERGINETASFRTLSTFIFGRYTNEHKKAFGDLYLLNDDTLDGGKSITSLKEEDSYIILIPDVGAIAYKDSQGNEALIAAGQSLVLYLKKGVVIEITNPFKEELVNFIQARIKANDESVFLPVYPQTYPINEHINAFIPLLGKNTADPLLRFSLSIGKFMGRGETVYPLSSQSSGIFLFVLEGAFETAGRLLHTRDGLALWKIKEAELEALSNDAIVLLIEIPLSK